MVTLKCNKCNNNFKVFNCRAESAKYCSVTCRNIGHKGKRFSTDTEFKLGQKFSVERNEKISMGHKNKPKPWLYKEPKLYIKICKYCKLEFKTLRSSRTICDSDICQTNKYTLRKINPLTELNRRDKISKTLKGKIPKNLKQNIKSNNLYRQYDMYEIIKKYYPYAEYNFYLKTDKSFRILDTAIPDLKIDFEYNGKVHLMKSVIEKDKQRKKELQELGWRIIIINRNNFKFMDKICIKLKGELYGRKL